MLSTHLIILNYPVILSHQLSTTVCLETYPFIHFIVFYGFFKSKVGGTNFPEGTLIS